LKRLTNNLILAFDMDDAGFRATKRGVDLANELGFGVSVLDISSGKDPADFVKERPGEFAKLVSESQPIMAYYFNRVFGKFSADKIEGKKFIALTLLSEIKRLPSAVERSGWLRELSLRLGVSESDLKEEMERVEIEKTELISNNNTDVEKPKISVKTRREILSERLLALLLKKPEFIAEAVKAAAILPKNDFEILSALAANQNEFSATRAALSADLRPRLDFLYLAGDYELEKADANFDIGDEVKLLIKEIERERHKESLQKIGQQIRKCESRLNGSVGQAEEGLDMNQLTDEFQNVTNKLYKIDENKK